MYQLKDYEFHCMFVIVPVSKCPEYEKPLAAFRYPSEADDYIKANGGYDRLMLIDMMLKDYGKCA